jgi:SAM-dependent methyltransferase
MKRYRAIAAYYDAENARHEILKNDVPFFLGQLPRWKRLDVLEVAVGTGRAAIPIAQAGHRVVGADYVEDMLAIARRKRDGVGLTERELRLVKQDALSLNLRKRFDWVCVFFNTMLAFGSLEELDQVLDGVRRHLKRDGRFFFDVFHPDYARLTREEEKGLERDVFFVPELGRTVFRETDIVREMAKQVMHVTFRYKWFDEYGREKRERFAFDMTCIFPRELRLLVERNGMRVEKLWGNYDGSEFGEKSPRMIARCVLA